MRMLQEDGMPGRQRRQPRRVDGIRRSLSIVALSGLVVAWLGCGGSTREPSPPAGEQAGAMGEGTLGATSSISLTWQPQNSCVTFGPRSTTIHVGDRVNFTTSMDSVSVTVASGLFSAGDTTFTVRRGVNETSPVARAVGTYPLSSDPVACEGTEAGGGPSIIVDSGDPVGQP